MHEPFVPPATPDRRAFLAVSAVASGLALAGCASTARIGDEDESEGEVLPGEDLMQEHGVLERVLLVYAESARRIEQGDALDTSIVARAASLVRDFVEQYHEKTEEQFVFPRLESARREVELVTVLRRQHDRGRAVTEDVLRLARGNAGAELGRALRSFERMYRPHAAREDTVIFPAFRAVVGRDEYRELGEQFEDREHKLLGPNGFENAVAEVAKLESALGIHDLAQFTP